MSTMGKKNSMRSRVKTSLNELTLERDLANMAFAHRHALLVAVLIEAGGSFKISSELYDQLEAYAKRGISSKVDADGNVTYTLDDEVEV